MQNHLNDLGQKNIELKSIAQVESELIAFLTATYQKQDKKYAVIAVSGGIDSAVSLTLLTKALGMKNVTALLLPYGDQDMSDAKAVLEWNGFTKENWQEINIKPMVDSFASQLGIEPGTREHKIGGNKVEKVRLGNIMARSRMICVYDFAKSLDALVCGTENKSEKYLAYFTRFGDEASDIEPIQHLFKTQVRELATYLGIPHAILHKAPSAGLWEGQSDEQEFGFTYDQADTVLHQYIDQNLQDPDKITAKSGVPKPIVAQVLAHVKANAYKHEVPYVVGE